jgi:hypothetical protein
MCGQVDKALHCFEESLKAQDILVKQSIYDDYNYSTNISVLNNSITKGNLGFLALVKRDIPRSLSFLESSLKVSARAMPGSMSVIGKLIQLSV